MSSWLLLVGNAAREGPISDENGPKIVLASSSENRLALLRQIGIVPSLVRPSTCAEDLPRSLSLSEFVEQTAKQKADQVASQLRNENVNFDLLIACDTMISIDGKMLGKPRDRDDAFAILRELDGRKHQVRTGICLVSGEGYEKLDRAGAYAIQGKGAALIKAVYGSYTNVVGLPVHELVEEMNKILTMEK